MLVLHILTLLVFICSNKLVVLECSLCNILLFLNRVNFICSFSIQTTLTLFSYPIALARTYSIILNRAVEIGIFFSPLFWVSTEKLQKIFCIIKNDASCGLPTQGLYCTGIESFYITLIVINYTRKIGDIHAAVRPQLHPTHTKRHDVD